MQLDLEIYIVYHDLASYELFQKNNSHIDTSRFKYILVGNYDGVGETAHENHIVASRLPFNIEHHESLLTFTAWYAISKNKLLKHHFIGIFEYDVIFKKDIFELKPTLSYPNSIVGFLPRQVIDDAMYLEWIPSFCNLLDPAHIKWAKQQDFWSATTNMIMPKWFLNMFVCWYAQYIPKILEMPGHAHYHERAVNVFAANQYMDLVFHPEYLEHKELGSHGIEFTQY